MPNTENCEIIISKNCTITVFGDCTSTIFKDCTDTNSKDCTNIILNDYKILVIRYIHWFLRLHKKGALMITSKAKHVQTSDFDNYNQLITKWTWTTWGDRSWDH